MQCKGASIHNQHEITVTLEVQSQQTALQSPHFITHWSSKHRVPSEAFPVY